MSDREAATVEVRLVDIPVDVHRAVTEHQEELRSEFQLIGLGSAQGEVDVPKRLFELIDELNDRFEEASTPQRVILDEAMARGDAVIPELRYVLPRGVDEGSAALSRMLDECDDFCRRGEGLLTLATPPEAVAYRRWFLGEFVAQVRGADPLPWPEADHALLAAEPRLRGE